MESIKKMVPYLLVNIVAFYLLPLIAKDTESILFVLLIALPANCFVTAAVFGALNSFNLLYPIFVGLLFIPAVFIYLNESALFYCVIYGVIALMGNFIGMLFFKITKK
ncbi:MAG TPA: hypothetical protein PK631_02445 [Erysipelotrichaceae bacterium]|nr:hypothetical protein [Erysipelotrichaceae bacterium]